MNRKRCGLDGHVHLVLTMRALRHQPRAMICLHAMNASLGRLVGAPRQFQRDHQAPWGLEVGRCLPSDIAGCSI